MSTWYLSPLFTTITGAAVGVIGTAAISFYLFYKSKKFMRVDCLLDSPISLLELSDKIKDKIEIKYMGENADIVYLFSFDIINTGNQSIENQPILVQLDESAKIADYAYSTEPGSGFGEILELGQSDSSLKLEVELLNPRDKISFEIFTIKNATSRIDIYLKNKDVVSRVISRSKDYSMVVEGSLVERLIYSITAVGVQAIIGQPIKITYRGKKSDK